MLPHDIQGDPSTLPSTGVRRTKEAKTLLQAAQECQGGKGAGNTYSPRLQHSLSFLGVQITEGDSVEGVVSSEEQPERHGREHQGQRAPTTASPQPSPAGTGDTPMGLP